MATIQMVADVWASAPTITRMYDDGSGVQCHHLRWRGFYIFRAGSNEGLTNDDPWEVVIIKRSGELIEQHRGDTGAVAALSDIARGHL
jgi:hypothetical protein